MKLPPILALALILCFACSPTDPDWRPLLQSNGLDDFEILNGTAKYERDGDMITGYTTFKSPNTFLATKEDYGDFELQFDVLMTEGLNSGVQIRSISDPNINNGRVHGYQIEIEDSQRGWAAGIYDEARRGWLYPVDRNPSALRQFKKGEWNHYYIIATGDTLQTWLNGQPVARLVDNMTASGLIGFQVHSIGNEKQANQTITWKNIQIKTNKVGLIQPSEAAPLCEIIPAADTGTSEFIIQDDHQIKMLAGEPQVAAPVAAELDAEGNIWVVELPGYMRDIDGSEEDFPDGKIVVLSDINGDGVFDRRMIHRDGLVAPRALCLTYGGLLYNDAKALYFENLSNGEITLVDSAYVMGGNIEHQPNGLYYNLDNWIYSAKSNARYRKINDQWIKEATTIRGQWGMSSDLHGRLVYNNNSNGLRGDKVMPNTVIDNPHLEIKALVRNQLSDDQRVYPIQATALNRGYIPGVLDRENKLINFTSVCGPEIYKGGGAWHQDAFVCAPEINAIKQYDLSNSRNPFNQTYEHTYKNKEFLVSKDETFRPVNIYNHPKGGMIIVDLRKGIIQHRAYMTHYLREIIKEKGFDNMPARGRIYSLTPSGQEMESFSFWPKDISTADIVQLLDHENGAMRMAAQKSLIARNDDGLEELVKGVMAGFGKWGKIHSMWTLEGINKLDQSILESFSNGLSPEVAYQIINIADIKELKLKEILLENILALNNEDLDLQLAHLNDDRKIVLDHKAKMASKHNNKAEFAEALLSNTASFANVPATSVLGEKSAALEKNIQEDKKIAPSFITYQFSDNRNEGFPLYNTYCLSCHGPDGFGQDGLAPPILHSQYLDGPSDKLAALILQGLQGPITVSDKKYEMNLVMPGLKHNPDLGDAEISAIISFVNNAFSKEGRGIKAEQVGKIRAQLGDRMELLTEAEVLGWETEE